MKNLALLFVRDENGFLVSAELVLVASIAVLSLIVGLTEVASGINHELEDVGSAFGSVNQSYKFFGFSGCKGHTVGSSYGDMFDTCDSSGDITCTGYPTSEGGYGY